MNEQIKGYIKLIKEHIYSNYEQMFRPPTESLPYPFITPGSDQYDNVLWDWDSWLTNVALRQLMTDLQEPKRIEEAIPYEQGCILNFLSFCDMDGWMPIVVAEGVKVTKPEDIYSQNMHKPVLAQHAAFLIKQDGGNAEWLRDKFHHLQAFVNNYRYHHRHKTGLYYWQNDLSVGIDNDPCVYFRPPKSSGSIYLNCLMYKELLATAYIAEALNLDEIAVQYLREAEQLKGCIQEHCYDERDGFYYSVDFNLLGVDDVRGLHQNMPRDYDCLIMRIGVWSGFMAMWAGIATSEQASRMTNENYKNPLTYNAPFGVRSLSRLEKMYNLKASGNPSSWLGSIWGIANYMTFKGLLDYGYTDEARELAEKTVSLFGRDLERFGALHEYYQPENGEPIINKGFKCWNYLVLNMIAWLEERNTVFEF